jgi:hypothetical protein
MRNLSIDTRFIFQNKEVLGASESVKQKPNDASSLMDENKALETKLQVGQSQFAVSAPYNNELNYSEKGGAGVTHTEKSKREKMQAGADVIKKEIKQTADTEKQTAEEIARAARDAAYQKKDVEQNNKFAEQNAEIDNDESKSNAELDQNYNELLG